MAVVVDGGDGCVGDFGRPLPRLRVRVHGTERLGVESQRECGACCGVAVAINYA